MPDWGSKKQRRVTYSSYGAKIFAYFDADDYGLNLKHAYRSVFEKHDFPHVLIVYLKDLFDTITTLHDGREYRLRQTLQRVWDSFESQEINLMRLVRGPANVADAITKRSTHSHRFLKRSVRTGKLELPQHRSFELDSEHWF